MPNAQKLDEAERLAKGCLADAKRAGISEQDLEDAAEADLLDSMLKALQFAEDTEMDRVLGRDPFQSFLCRHQSSHTA